MWQPRSVCIITQTIGFGGTEVHTLNLVRCLLDHGYRVELVSCRHNVYDGRIPLSPHVEMISTRLSVDERGAAALRKWRSFMDTLRSPVLIFPKGHSNLGSVHFLRACSEKFRKVYHIEHLEALSLPPKRSRMHLGGLVPGLGLWWYREHLKRRIKSFYVDRTVAVSRAVASRLLDDIGYAARKVRIVPNGIDWRRYRRDTALGASFRAAHRIPADAFVFGMVTRLERIKGIDVALEAFRRLSPGSRERPVRLAIAGEGSEEARLREQARRLGIAAETLFLGFAREPLAHYCASDVILFSSRKEGLPLALLEGMAAGCMPIVSRISGMPEAVDRPETGWVTNPEDPADLARAMEEALSLPPAAVAAMRTAAVRRVREHYDAHEKFRDILVAFRLHPGEGTPS